MTETHKTMHQQRCEWYDMFCSGLGQLVAVFTYPNYFKDVRYFDNNGMITMVDTGKGLENIKITLVSSVPSEMKGMKKLI